MTVLGRALWVLVPLGMYLLQWWVASAWPIPYDPWRHTVSDLGYTGCGSEQRPDGVRHTCSPRHRAYNVGSVLVCLGVSTGGLMLRQLWSPHRRTASVLLVLLCAVGTVTAVVPGDVDLLVHSLGGLGLAVLQPALLATCWRAHRRDRPLLAATAAVAGIVCVLGTLVFAVALVSGAPVGAAERVAAETFYLWLVVAAVLAPHPGRPRNTPTTRNMPATRMRNNGRHAC